MKDLRNEIINLREERMSFINEFYKKNNINQDWLSNGGRGYKDLYGDVCVKYPEFGKKIREYDALIDSKEEELGENCVGLF